jgi:hypothetical protein
MHATERNYLSRSAVSIYAPFRFVFAVAMALLIATLIASSSAHGMMLGDAVAQSTLGSRLRVVIPVSAEPGESLQLACFRLLPAPGDGSAQIVTGRVSLERAASAPRVVVTTANAVNDPAIRFSIQAGCEGSTRRLYVVLLDPPARGAPAATAANQALAREPRQERPAPQPATARRSSNSTALSATRVEHVPVAANREPTTTMVAPEVPVRARAPTADEAPRTTLYLVAGVPALPAVSAAAARARPAANGGSYLGSYLAASLAVAGVIALVVMFARMRRAPPEVPQWTRSSSYAGPRSFAELTATSATLSQTHSDAAATATPVTSSHATPKSITAPPTGGVSAPASRSSSATVDPSTIDTLLDELDPDIVEERAVREAWAAARSDVEREMDGNEVLQAIEAAERALLLTPPAPAQTAIERALDDDLLQPPRHR